MNVGIIGTGEHAAVRARAASAQPEVDCVSVLDDAGLAAVSPAGPGGAEAAPLEALLLQSDAVFVTVPAAAHFCLAEAATKQGVHVFLEWPPATSIRECKAIARLSEEAGVEVGISRPLRFHPVFAGLPAAWRAGLILLRREVAREEEAAWPRWLADAVDLCCALAQSSSIQRIDAEAVRNAAPWPDAVAFGLRFHSGTYAQISIRRSRDPGTGALYVGGAGFEVETAIGAAADTPDEPAVEAETQAFLRAVAGQRPAPVSILDGLHTMRLVERLVEKLR